MHTKELQLADIWAWPSVHHQVVKNFECLDGSRREAHNFLVLYGGRLCTLGERSTGPATLQSFPAALFYVFHHDLSSLAILDGLTPLAFLVHNSPINRASESHSQVHTYAGVKGRIHHRLVVCKVEVGEEPKRAERERENGGYNPLEEP